MSQVLTDIVPKLENICSYVNIDDRIKNNISKEEIP